MSPSSKIEWNSQAAAHLLRRAAFGGTPAEAENLASFGLASAVDQVLQAPDGSAKPPPKTDALTLQKYFKLQRASNKLKGGDLKASRVARNKLRRADKEKMKAIRFWWMDRMRSGPGATQEKLTLFWHGHFATSETKVKYAHHMLAQNETFRRLGLGSFRDLCQAMVSDPAMLIWLDGRQSRAKAPNENFAREIMELFALGEGHYSEDDVVEAARCFTGWRINQTTGEAEFVPRRFDDGRKRLFGRSGRFTTAEAVKIICAQSECPKFLATKIWEFYAYPQPSAELVDSLAKHYRAHDFETRALLEMIFTHPEFYSARARAIQVKSPVQWAVQASRELGRQLLPPSLLLPLTAELGQNLFMPPSVKGWDGGITWINSATLIRRSNTARLFALAAPPLPVDSVDSMNAFAWASVAPAADRATARVLERRLKEVFLVGKSSEGTDGRLRDLWQKSNFPCDDETVREASVVLLGAPEYNLC